MKNFAIVFLLTVAVASGQSYPVVLSPKLPDEVEEKFGRERRQTDFDFFGWQEFVALNWPARADGSPNNDLIIGQDPTAPRVWEFFMGPDAVFLPNGARPQWRPGAGLSRTQLTKASEEFDTPFVDALHFPVIDQDANFAVFGLGLNRPMFNYIVKQELYSKNGQRTDKDGNRLPIDGEKFVSFPPGSLEIKVAWRVFPEKPTAAQQAEMKRYFIRKSVINVPPENSETGRPLKIIANLGMVGFHIVQKTPERPQWVWTTFEQVDNVVPAPGDDRATFQDPRIPVGSPLTNLTPVPKGAVRHADPTKPYTEPYVWANRTPFAGPNVAIDSAIPTQAVRQNPNDEGRSTVQADLDSPGLNIAWQRALRAVDTESPWQYYQIISTQWPTKPLERKPGQLPGAPGSDLSVADYVGFPAPEKLANIPMEVYNQKTSSCMDCHSKAFTTFGNYSDFSYFLQLAK